MKSSKTVPQRLDDMVEWTGIPAMQRRFEQGEGRRYRLRVWPMTVILIGTGGLLLGLIDSDRYFLGQGLVSAAMLGGLWLPIFGPVKPWNSPALVDEYDRRVRSDAYIFTLTIVASGALIALFGLGLRAELAEWPRDALVRAMQITAFYLMTLLSCLPTLHASVRQAPIEDD